MVRQMKILLFDMGSYIYRDVLSTLKELGHEVHTVYYNFKDRLKDDFFIEKFTAKVNEYSCDLIFSVNFFPLVALVADSFKLPYASWSYDSPLAESLEAYFKFERNYIFLFDRSEVQEYLEKGHKNVFHMPLAAGERRLIDDSTMKKKYSAEVSFVGQLYSEMYEALIMPLDDYTKGYLESALVAQQLIMGENILKHMLNSGIMKKVNDAYRAIGNKYTLTKTGLQASIQKKITNMERIVLLETVGEEYDTKFYSNDIYEFQSNVKNMGPVHYFDEMPYVFRYSKLNLCPTVRSIISGIPLRALDIMKSRGTLFCSWQPELTEYFCDGESVILYSSLEEAVDKIRFYLKNESLREKICLKGKEITDEKFRYRDRISEILKFTSTN